MAKQILRRLPFLKKSKKYLKAAINSLIFPNMLRKKVKDVYSGKPLVVVVGRRMLQKDVDQIKDEAPDYSFLVVSPEMWKGAQANFTPKRLQEQTFYKERSLQNGYNWSKNMKWANIVLNAIGKEKIAAIVNSNFDYWQDYAFHLKCKQEGIPFIVMMRENHVSRSSIESFLERYARYRSDVSGVAVASSVQKKLLSSNGVLDKENIWVTGYPRNDPALDIKSHRSDQERDTVLFLGHDDFSYGLKDMNSYSTCLHDFFKAFERDESVRKIIIKTKDARSRQRHFEMLGSEMERSCARGKLEIVSKPNVFDLVREARLVVGGNSQSTVEAMFSAVPVVFPKFIVEKDSPYNIFINYESDDKALIRFSSSSQEFTKDLVRLAGQVNEIDSELDIVRRREKFFGHNIFFDVDKPSAAYFVEMLNYYCRRYVE